MPDFTGKVALVTGAGAGIGAATAALMAKQGAQTWFADRVGDAAVARASDCRGAQSLVLDVTRDADWADAMAKILGQAGRLDILVNAAGISRTNGDPCILEAAIDDWRRVFAVNVEGTLLGCQHARRVMGLAGGAIVNVSSTTALAPTAGLGAYGASKAAVLQLTKSVAAACSLAGLPIRCNAVLPGMTDTAMTGGMPRADREKWERQIPAGRFAEPGEIAAVIAFLASSEAAYVNGAGFLVDGGLTGRPVVR
jgi:NAD(P)-dependent dehydrogenase (short-subunit alcohol dehydrogenase family)